LGGAVEGLAVYEFLRAFDEGFGRVFAELLCSADRVGDRRLAECDGTGDAAIGTCGLGLVGRAKGRKVDQLATCIAQQAECVLGIVDRARADALDGAAAGLGDAVV
jgi:hypothetical protein